MMHALKCLTCGIIYNLNQLLHNDNILMLIIIKCKVYNGKYIKIKFEGSFKKHCPKFAKFTPTQINFYNQQFS